ncbi:MAG: hypothetical protein JWM16_3190 [Verrucomicrobiales bacterium]|nr:hypothetical protein [Verrucomicrobiales bacterium]
MSDKPSAVGRSSILRFFRWLGSRQGMRRVAVILIWMITVVALFYGIENWRGRRAWQKYQQTLLARGEQLDLRAMIPQPVPDDQNFASTPFVKSWFDRKKRFNSVWGDNFSELSSKVPDPVNNKRLREFVDLGAWQKAFAGEIDAKKKIVAMNLEGEARAKAAKEVLEELKGIDSLLNELREASQRPFSRYPVQYDLENPWGIRLPHLSQVRSTCRRLQLKACAELAAGRPERAVEDIRLQLHMVDSLKGEPFLIAYLVRVADLQTAVQPVWEGLMKHQWTEAQLKELQTWFEKANFKTEVKQSLDYERAAALWTVDLLRKKGNFAELVSIEADTGTLEIATRGLMSKLLRLMPRGWSYQEQLTYCRFFDEQFETTLRDGSPRLVPAELETRKAKVEKQLQGRSSLNRLVHHQLAAALLLPGLENMGLRAATGQVCADEAGIACALERYRLVNQGFPEKLEELVPKFLLRLPQDIISGQPYKYRKEGETGYDLYSIGWNERDDGGLRGRKLFDEKEGDWVWQIR